MSLLGQSLQSACCDMSPQEQTVARLSADPEHPLVRSVDWYRSLISRDF
jgi:hypothetical protein